MGGGGDDLDAVQTGLGGDAREQRAEDGAGGHDGSEQRRGDIQRRQQLRQPDILAHRQALRGAGDGTLADFGAAEPIMK